MAGPSSQTDIINKAVVLLGSSERLSNIDAGGANAANLRTLWGMARRSLLASHPWNFALKRAKLLPDADNAPEFGYTNAFEVPEDCLRWLPWARGEKYYFEGEEEGDFILSDESAIYIRYITDVENEGKWSALFADAMAYQLAFEYCEGRTQMTGLRDRLKDDLDRKLGRPVSAKLADGLSTGKRGRGNPQVQSRWASARHRPTGILPR